MSLRNQHFISVDLGPIRIQLILLPFKAGTEVPGRTLMEGHRNHMTYLIPVTLVFTHRICATHGCYATIKFMLINNFGNAQTTLMPHLHVLYVAPTTI